MNTEKYREKEKVILEFTPEERVNDQLGNRDLDYKFCKKHGLLKKWKGKRLLHAGCNSGGNSIALSSAGIKVVGVDINERAIDLARQMTDEHKHKIRFYVDNLVNMKLIGLRFDAMFCSNVLEHIYPEDLETTLLNLKSHLKKNASFYITVPIGWSIPDKVHTIIFDDVKAIIKHFDGRVVKEELHFTIYR